MSPRPPLCDLFVFHAVCRETSVLRSTRGAHVFDKRQKPRRAVEQTSMKSRIKRHLPCPLVPLADMILIRFGIETLTRGRRIYFFSRGPFSFLFRRRTAGSGTRHAFYNMIDARCVTLDWTRSSSIRLGNTVFAFRRPFSNNF